MKLRQLQRRRCQLPDPREAGIAGAAVGGVV